jgi:hypothetical protein
MTIRQILGKYIDSQELIIRVYKAEDYGNEKKAKTLYPMGYLYELPNKLCLGEYNTMMNEEIKFFKASYNVAIHFYI